ncbi:transketolase [Candidatus Nitronereus thalassa]|uniref:Transketolase n=1 Tax=Candidatus Nitronereus thalassa TaxID=3020898 RepID=A0ABU3KBE2_9BACT|nr:transketolase [Candidatus Nitronereus thalassa]MDT7043744.1 transketolase [Candidatus Nitronereus thalassa]
MVSASLKDSSFDHRLIKGLRSQAAQLRMDSVHATSSAGSGHATSCCSAADIVATLFFGVMRFHPEIPRLTTNDRFILSKGHAAPLLYAAWAAVGLYPREELSTLRQIDSDLEGHPTPRLPFVHVPTGSLGQGLSAGVGMALNAKYLDQLDYRTYVLMGDGESVEGAVWEAAEIARYYDLDNLCAIIDVNRLGQSDPTIHQHRMERYVNRWSGFGWHTIVVDGHDPASLLQAFAEAEQTLAQPTVILAKTIKGKGISFLEDQGGRHGKALKGEELENAIQELSKQIEPEILPLTNRNIPLTGEVSNSLRNKTRRSLPAYKKGDQVATRQAFGEALLAVGKAHPHVVVLDGDVKNSTHVQQFADECPDQFFESFIAEQNMIGTAMGLASCGKIPFAATFAAFLTRAHDFIRMGAIGRANIKLMGSHAGVSTGEDGPSQMGLEDIAMMATQPDTVVLYPSDAVCTHWAVQEAVAHQGMVYIRTNRPETPILYDNDESFCLGGFKVVRHTPRDLLTVVTAGVTLFETLNAQEQLERQGISVRVIDLYCVKPIDAHGLYAHISETEGRVLIVEDHYEHGGFGDAVRRALGRKSIESDHLAVRNIPRSGKSQELLDRYTLSTSSIIKRIQAMIQ